MAVNLFQLLGARQLTKQAQGVKGGLTPVLPEAFYRTSRRITGDKASYLRVNGTREVARMVARGSPATRVGRKDVEDIPFQCLHSFIEQPFDMDALDGLRNPEAAMIDDTSGALWEIDRQTKHMRALLDNLFISSVHQALARFHIYRNLEADGSYSLYHQSSGAEHDIDFGVAAAQLNQLNILGEGAIIGASWATTTTDIIGDLRAIRKQMLKLAGWRMKYAFYGENIPGYMAGNNSIKEYLSRNPAANESFLNTGDIPNGLQGYTWIPADEMFFIDETGTVRELVGVDEIVFTPEPGDDWWEVVEGTVNIPANLNVLGIGNSAMSGFESVRGHASYAVMNHNPVTVQQFMGHTWIPLLKAPKAVCRADVTP